MDLDGRYYRQPNLHKFDATNVEDDGYSKVNMIICEANIKQ